MSKQNNSLLCHVRNIQGDTYFILVDITEEAVESVAHKISGGSGPGGTDLEAQQGWILKFSEDSTRLRTSVETFVDWLANGIPPWAAYRAFMPGRLIVLDKQPAVRLVGIVEIWRRLFSNIVLKFTGPEETIAYQDEQLCAVLKAGIDGTFHGVQYIWDKNSTMEDWRLLILDPNNALNDINQVGMLLVFRHLWLPRACFIFNCYHHWSSIFLRNGNGIASFLHSKEGVMQRDPLKIIAYRIGILPLINNLKQEISDVTQLWYAENARYLGTFTRIETYFYSLTFQGPGRRYYPELSKRVLILHPENLKAGKELGARHGFKVGTGA